ncbi:MAG: hypothetical protein ACFFD2_04375, partial [Promethearchaeota archaeon]
MLKIGCAYSPKITRIPISEYPSHFQVAELGNSFYRLLSKKDIANLAKLPVKNKDFEFLILINWYISHKYQFRHSNYRDKALDIMEKTKFMANELKSNKFLIRTHYVMEYDDIF